VVAAANPLRGLTGDAAHIRSLLASIAGPVVLVGHSYGGAVITEAGSHPKVGALVYISAFAPDRGESVKALIDRFPAEAPQMPGLPPRDGYVFQDPARFHASFGADLPADRAAFMADSQAPWGVNAAAATITNPAWRTKPSWYLIATDDREIPPAAQRAMSRRAGSTALEIAATHAVYITQPTAVADLIKEAARAAR
jgi:pimeloyl-ACP methyl ester carboxylesterase